MFGGAGVVFAEECEKAVTEQPGLDIDIVNEDDDGAEDADDAEVFDEFVFFPDGVKHTGCGGVAEAAAESAYCPLNPHKWQAEEKKSDEVRNHKGAAAVSCGLNGKAEKVSQSDGAAGNSKYHSELTGPSFSGHNVLLTAFDLEGNYRLNVVNAHLFCVCYFSIPSNLSESRSMMF